MDTLTRERHICTTCHRLLLAYAFPHNGAHPGGKGGGGKGGWVDSEGIRRRSECRTCKQQRDNARYHGVPFEPIIPSNREDVIALQREFAPASRVPVEPFAAWIERKHRQWLKLGGTSEGFATCVGLNERAVERYMRREYRTVRWSLVDQVLVNEGSTDLWELYPDLYPRDLEEAA